MWWDQICPLRVLALLGGAGQGKGSPPAGWFSVLQAKQRSAVFSYPSAVRKRSATLVCRLLQAAPKSAAAPCCALAISPSKLLIPPTMPCWFSHAAPRCQARIRPTLCLCPDLCGATLLWLGNPQGGRIGVLSSGDLLAASHYTYVTQFSRFLPPGLISVVFRQWRFEGSLVLWGWRS